ncbi:MAG: aldo/keto reductase [Sphaerochaetaceae bacterium]|nr:aldo/keto reductase [Sphaerochaetaceae bacterium]
MTIPSIGLGTFGSDHVSNEAVAKSVIDALQSGYQMIDCASVYGNEKEIGAAIEKSGVERDKIWLTGKLWNDMHGKDDVKKSVLQTLSDLKTDYLDLYLVHWPFPNYHPPKCDVSSRSPNARPYIHEEFMVVWNEMEKLVDDGLVRNIGTSNMTMPKMERLLADCRIRPFANEMELHPYFQQQEFVSYLKNNGIIPIGFCPIGSPERPERDRTEEDVSELSDPILRGIAESRHVHPAEICLKWANQNGIIPIPQSANPKHLASNLNSVTHDPLTDQELSALSKIDKNCRLIKGQVFLWEGAKDWHALWDEDGRIAK